MNQNKVHSPSNVLFSWENKPGVSKTTNQEFPNEGRRPLKLPPPPCPKEKARVAVHDDIRIPLPPCMFQQPLTSRKGSFRKVKDPFLVALKECTKSGTGKGKLSQNDQVSSGLKKGGLFNKFSCKHSCSVVDDNLLKICQLPDKKDEEG